MDLMEMYASMTIVAKFVAFVLIIMSMWSLGVGIERFDPEAVGIVADRSIPEPPFGPGLHEDRGGGHHRIAVQMEEAQSLPHHPVKDRREVRERVAEDHDRPPLRVARDVSQESADHVVGERELLTLRVEAAEQMAEPGAVLDRLVLAPHAIPPGRSERGVEQRGPGARDGQREKDRAGDGRRPAALRSRRCAGCRR